VAAYKQGIFPWYSEGDPLLWWSPDPRSVLFPDELRVHRSMRPLLNRQAFRLTLNASFEHVIRACRRSPRPGQDGTWITPEMLNAYLDLHQAGYAHSCEAWLEDRLVGGLYGVAMGACFFGESMFAQARDASKYAFILLVRALQAAGYTLIDCQVHNQHLESLGAREIPRSEFMDHLALALEQKPAPFWPRPDAGATPLNSRAPKQD
jgi:leucyl/phenylalanyl-tRNA--protein transferase